LARGATAALARRRSWQRSGLGGIADSSPSCRRMMALAVYGFGQGLATASSDLLSRVNSQVLRRPGHRRQFLIPNLPPPPPLGPLPLLSLAHAGDPVAQALGAGPTLSRPPVWSGRV